MKSQKILRQAPWLLVLLIGGIAVAQSATTGRVFPYVGYLEEDGFPVDGERYVRINLHATDAGGTSCDTQDFADVTIAAGRFQVEVIDVPDACLVGGELFAAVSIGPDAGNLVALSTGVGDGRVRIGSVPFAAASPSVSTLLVAQDADITRDLEVGRDSHVTRNTTGDGYADFGGNLWANQGYMGFVGHNNWTGWSHENRVSTTGYALIQHADGDTILNAEAGETLRLRQGNVDRLTMGTGGNWTASGNMNINGSLSVGNGLPLSVSGIYTASQANGGAPAATTMTSSTRSACFLTRKYTHDNMANESVSDCYIRDSGTNWQLWVNTDLGSGDPDTTCEAMCLSW
jgi:hypothetical protein